MYDIMFEIGATDGQAPNSEEPVVPVFYCQCNPFGGFRETVMNK